ncbi:MAG: hypothetical protein V4692_06475, partial [Bdellovibrionota bacterium]
QIRDFILCQGRIELASCAGLATTLTGAAVTTAAKARYASEFVKSKKQIIEAIAEGMHEEWRNGRKLSFKEANSQRKLVINESLKKTGNWKSSRSYFLLRAIDGFPEKQIYDPVIRNIGGVDYDIANRSYDRLPEQIKAGRRTAANSVFEKVSKQIASGGRFNEKFITGSSVSAQEQSFLRAAVKQIAKQEANLAGKSVAGATRAVLKVLGTKAAFLAAGPAGIIAAVGFEVLGSSSTGCSDYQDLYTHRTVVDGSCKNTYLADARVLGFLDLPEEKKAAILGKSSNAICEYYKGFYQEHLDRPEFKSLTCEGANGFTLEARGKDGNYVVEGRMLGQDYLKQINVKRNAGWIGNFQFFADGRPSTPITAQNGKLYRNLKLYITEAAECCASNDADNSTCLAKFNPTGKNRDNRPSNNSSKQRAIN